MNINESIFKKGLVSKSSVASFVLAILSYVILSVALIFKRYCEMFFAYSPLIIFIFLAVSLMLSIIDLRRKNKKKIFSIISIILSCMYFLCIIGSIVIFVVIHRQY